jgi:hypothetical protein
MRSTRTVSTLAGTVLAAAGLVVLLPTAALATVACSETALVDAVKATNSAGGGTITLTPGCTYTLTSSHGTAASGPNGLPVITTTITLAGNANVITRSGTAPAFRIAEVSSTGKLTLQAVTLSNGIAASGGGILNAGTVTLTGSALIDNTATSGHGGGVFNGPSSAATFTSSTLSGNTAPAGNGGALYSTGGAATFTSSSISGNHARLGGGVATVNATFTISSTPVTANTATVNAGGIHRLNGTITLTTSSISGNSSDNCVTSSPAVPGCVN